MLLTQSTTKYEMFKDIASNREVDEKHVRKLMQAITKKNMLNLNPILVNDKMEVVDGQHRLEAAKRLGVQIFYLTDSSIQKADIAALNSNQKGWTMMDYINFYTVEKRPGFDKLSAFLSQHPMLPPSTAMVMISDDGSRNTKGVLEGRINTANYENGLKIAEMVKEYRNMCDHAYERNFVLAVIHCFYVPGYDHAAMQAQLETQSRCLVRCINKKQYIELFEEIYNRNKSKNKLSFFK